MDLNNPIISKSAPRKPFVKMIHDVISAFSATEKTLFFILIIIVVISGLVFLSEINNRFLSIVPDFGGTITEGIVGVPRFVNPVLAISDPDKDLTSLVFSGLIKATPDGKMIGDLAEKFEVSADGRSYSFTLKENALFHDGEPVTTDDVEFTIERIRDSAVKSPKRSIWDSVMIKKTDARNITFTLKQPYAPFIENFTVGIIPRHIWEEVPADEFSFSQLNVDAVGSGPYKIKKVKRNSYGLPTTYTLRAFSDYALGQPFVKNIELYFYPNENELLDAYKAGDIESLSGISPRNLNELVLPKSKIANSTLPRIFGVFFNQNQAAVFINKEVREALSVAIDRDRIVNSVLAQYGKAIDSPLPASNAEVAKADTDRAIAILSKAGWAINEKSGVMEKKVGNVVTPLAFSIATGEATELKQAAEFIKEDWEKIGASVDLKIFEIGDLNQNVIRPRKFDALFFGEIVGREFDLYPFWHSSQRNDPGLNIALYANISGDKILETLRTTQNREDRMAKARELEILLQKDMPAAFIYSPDFIYVIPKNLQNVNLGALLYPGERFLNVHEWYIETNKVWKIFTSKR